MHRRSPDERSPHLTCDGERGPRDVVMVQSMVTELMAPSGLLLRRHALEAGYTDKHLGRLVKSGQLSRIRQGAYAPTDRWTELDRRGRHVVLSEAVMTQYRQDRVALSHDSGVLKHDGPDYGLDLTAVHVTHLVGGGRREAGVVHHEGTCGLLDLTRVDGDWVTSPARTVLDVAMLYGVEAGVVVADDFIRRKLTSTAELRQLYERVRQWPGALVLRIVIGLATGKSDSVGESLGWLLFRNQRLPRPVQQFEVFRPSGHLAGRTDWAWPERRVLAEFDGFSKYLRSRREGESIEECVLREKRREDLLRELTGFWVVRLIWADLFRPQHTADRIRAAFAQAAA